MHDKSTARASVGSPYPAGREPLSPRQDIHVLTRARAVHGALVATPGRQDTAQLGVAFVASIKAAQVGVMPPTALDLRLLEEASTTNRRSGVPIGGSGKQAMDGLRRRVRHGCLPSRGACPARGAAASEARAPIGRARGGASVGPY